MISAKQRNAKTAVLVAVTAALCVAVVACAVYFEVSARKRTSHEIAGLRGKTVTLLHSHRISKPQAASLESRLSQARTELSGDDVRGAQKLLDGVRTYLRSHSKAV